jgi:hypothetical protein
VALLSDDLLAAQRGELPQCDELCGPFWAAVALRATGIDVTQEEAAAVAGSVLAAPDSPSSLPPGEDGRVAQAELPVAAPGEPAGTSAHGVALAVERLSGGRLAAVPASGAWSAAALAGLLEALDGVVAVIANVDTGALWDPSATPDHLQRYLANGADEGPDNEWRVGHFLAIAGTHPGPGGTIVMLADSYASRATHLQPVERVAAALDGRGLLVVTDATHAPDARAAIEAAGLTPALWDNGSPVP